MSAWMDTAATPGARDVEMLAERFAARVGKLGVAVDRLASLDAVADLIAARAAQVPADVRRVVLAPALDAAYPPLRALVAARGLMPTAVDVTDPLGAFGPAAVGVSGAMLGIAETGTYAVADTLPDRMVRMLAHRHIVVLDIARLVPSLDEAGAWLRDRFTGADGDAARYASFVTGPSRTADIEMSLTVGAHGPAELRIVLLDLASIPTATPHGNKETGHARA